MEKSIKSLTYEETEIHALAIKKEFDTQCTYQGLCPLQLCVKIWVSMAHAHTIFMQLKLYFNIPT
jgi:hypothetical protein